MKMKSTLVLTTEDRAKTDQVTAPAGAALGHSVFRYSLSFLLGCFGLVVNTLKL